MKKYIVKTTSTATLENPNFAGQVIIAFYGKGQKLLGCEGSHAEAIHVKREVPLFMVREYGYNRLCDAKRSWIYNNPENTDYWVSDSSIVEVDC